jgi:uncharacterized cupredoxin-like copper-binding protein
MHRLSRAVLVVVAVAGFVLAACTTKAKNTVDVVATNTTCEPATTDLTAGKTTFSVRNTGSQETEMYVLQGTRTLGEVENIGPGTSRTLTVTLEAGDYELNCKPGQKGDGIKTSRHVTGAGGSTKAADRTVEVTAIDYAFTGMSGFTATHGETVEFHLSNQPTSVVEHELEFIGPDGKPIGEVSETKPGKDGEVTLTFDQPGRYTFKCGIDDHAQRGMQGTFDVT